MKKRQKKKVLHIVIASALILASVVIVLAGTIVDRRQIVVKPGSTTYSFTVNDGNGNMVGTCMQPKNQLIPSGGQTADFQRLSNTSRLAKLAYIGSKEFSTDVQQYAVGRAAAYVAGNVKYNNYEFGSVVNSLISRSAGNVAVPSNFEAYIVKPTNGGQQIIAWRLKPLPPPNGKVAVKKVTANNSHLVNLCPENYTLAGAVYGVYASLSNANADTGRLATLTTDANGNTKAFELKVGTYIVKEISAPKGYDIDPTPYTVKVESNKTATVTSKDPPKFDPLKLKIEKKAAEGVDKNLSLEGAEYTVKYFKAFLSEEQAKNSAPFKTWIFKTDSKGFIKFADSYRVGGDELFKSDAGIPVGLYGTYTFEETKAPAGFAKTEGIVALQQIKPGEFMNGQPVVLKDVTDVEKPQTVSITLNKVDAETGKPQAQGFGSLKGAEYDLYYFDPVKSEDVKVTTLVTDEKGFARYEGGKPGLYKVKETKASNGYIKDPEYHEVDAKLAGLNTANFDYVVTSKEKPITIEVEKTTVNEVGDKIALSGAELQLLDSNKKVLETFTSDKAAHVIKGLVPGKYYIRETKTPSGYLAPEKDVEFTVKDTAEAQHVEVFNEPIPEIKTTATFKDNKKNSKPGNSMTVVDVFEYKKALIGQEYLIKGELINKATGKAVAKAERRFTPKQTGGNVDINFNFDGSKFEGVELVVTEKLYKVKGQTEKLVASHVDLNDMKQLVSIPKIRTTALDKADNNKNIIASGKQTVIDKVSYTNLYPGKKYTVKGVLMNKATNKPVLDKGKEVTAEKTFTADKASGFVELEFTFDASALKGKTLVVFEKVYEDQVEVGSHSDITDKEQTVYVSGIRTTATDKINGGKDLNAAEKQTIVDKVAYNGLLPGKEYTIKGTLMSKDSGKAVLENGKEVTAETKFTPNKEEGIVTLEFVVNTSKLQGQTLVVFERIYEDGKEIATHTDIDDVDQSMYVPKVKTEASFKDGIKNAKPEDGLTVTDVFSYENLIKGQEYIIKGDLINKASGDVISKSEEKFTARDTNGNIKIKFKFDGSKLEGKDLVVTEKLYSLKDGKEKLVATHADLADMKQLVSIPKIRTTALDKADNNKNIIAAGKQTVIDKVSYTNLYPGKKYTVKGVLMNKATNKPVLDGGKEVTAEKTFTADKANGFLELEFTFDASALQGQTLVAFEKVYEDKIEVGSHADINDVDQTTYIPGIKTTATDKINGGKDLNAAEKQTVVDKVAYNGLLPGKEYTIKGTLMSKDTGKAVLENGKEVTAETKFTPNKEEGIVTLEFVVNTSNLQGQTLVVFERIYEDGKEIATHTDIDDVDQSMYVPKVKTEASFDNGNKNTKPDKDIIVEDVFSYQNAIRGQEYIIKGELVNKATGDVISKSEEKFTARDTNGNIKIKFKFDGSKLEGKDLVVTEKLYSLKDGKEKLVATHADLADMKQLVSIPKIRTTALDKADNNKNIIASGKQTVIDKVSYTNLYPGKKYTVKGVLMNKATNKPVLDGGKEVTAEKTFTADKASGFVELEFTFDASALKGKTLVVFEKVYEDQVEVGSHADIKDVDQTTYIPGIKTTATDKINGGKDLNAAEKQTVVDKVAYKSLNPGTEYTIKGTLMSKNTGEVIEEGGKPITAETKFTPKKQDGIVTLEFVVNTNKLQGQTLVVFEKLYENGKVVALHTDINDVDQSMYVPKVKTKATFENGNKSSKPDKKLSVIDVFSYENAVEGQAYIVKGKLINKATCDTVSESETKFTADKSNGDVNVKFNFDGSKLEGTDLVVTEQLYSLKDGKEKLVATHVDLNDMKQLVSIPKIRTTALDKADNNKNIIASGKQTVIDKVSYTNLYPGKKYTVKGVLMNKATNKPVLDNGKEVTAEKTFTADKADGFVELEFTFDASALKGQTLVAFEKVYEEKVEVGTHTDIKDKAQTTYVPEIKTTATDKINGGKDLNAAEKQTVVDKVAYKSLLPGKEYTIKGILMDKDTGESLKVNGKEVTSETKFTPNKEDGIVTLEFVVDTSKLQGKTIVVFEKLYEDGKELAIHTEINDVDQSMYIPKVKTKATFDNGNKNAKPEKELTVIDIFSYENLIKGEEYAVKGELVNKATGDVISKSEVKLTAKKPDDDVKIKFKVDGSKLEGTALVVTEKLYSLKDGKEKLVATHADLADMKQLVSIPKIRTTATDKTDGGKDINAAEKQTIIDKVAYANLYPGKEYTVKGVLMNKATNKPILDNGKKVTAEKTFTAEKPNGFVELEFTFNASALKGETIVVFEDVYEDKVIVGSHADINDKEQSIYVPEIRTTATSQDDNTKSVLPLKRVVIRDKVEYKNLIVGQNYQLNGTLVNAKSKEIVAKASGCFTAEKEDGHINLDFEFEATDLKGKDVVVFEELVKVDENGEAVKEVAEHSDITDKGQTVHVESPEVGTTATSKDDGGKNVLPIKKVTITDKVEYKNLVIGKEYTVKGVLMDKDTGEKLLVNGKEVVSETTFTAEEKNGFVNVVFEFNASELKGKEVVVFESLLHKGEEIGSHADIKDKGQTIKVENPNVKTTANFENGGKEAQKSENMTVIDIVKYENLVIGKEYTVKGILMDKETGKPFLDNGRAVTAEQKFTAEKANGEVQLKFIFNGSSLNNKELVVFEDIYYGEELIASHADINDKDQTVKVTPLPPAAKTGDDSEMLTYMLFGVSALLIMPVLYRKRQQYRG